MSAMKATPLRPTEVMYKDHKITLTLRPRTNDWHYSFTHTRTITVSNQAPRYDTALRQAKNDIDTLTGGTP